MDLCLFYEDAQSLFDTGKTSGGELGSADELASVIRGCGVSFFIIVQSLIGISPRLIPNLTFKVMGACGHKDRVILGAEMGMRPEELHWASHNLKPGTFVVQISRGNFRYPFLCTCEALPKNLPTVSETDIDMSLRRLEESLPPVVRAPEFERWTPIHSIYTSSSSENIEEEVRPTNGAEAEHPHADLSKQCLDYFEAIASNPLQSVTDRDSDLGVSSYMGGKFRDQLIAKELIKKISINPGGRGKRFNLLELTTNGRELLKDLDIRVQTGAGRGGLEHQHFCTSIADYLTSRGMTAVIEDESLGVRADIAVKTTVGIGIAIEVECTRGNEIQNITKDLKAGFKHVVSLIKEKGRVAAVKAKLALELDGDDLEFVCVGELRDFENVLEPYLQI